MDDYTGPEVYPPKKWMDECKALVRHEEVWTLLEEETPWIEYWDTGFTPMMTIACALLDVLAPQVGASYRPH